MNCDCGRESGQGLVEYALLLVLVAMALLVALMMLSDNIILGYARVIGGLSGQTIDEGAIYLGGENQVIQDSGTVCVQQLQDISFVVVDNNGELITDEAVSARFYGSGTAGPRVNGVAGTNGIVELAGPITVNGPCPLNISMSN